MGEVHAAAQTPRGGGSAGHLRAAPAPRVLGSEGLECAQPFLSRRSWQQRTQKRQTRGHVGSALRSPSAVAMERHSPVRRCWEGVDRGLAHRAGQGQLAWRTGVDLEMAKRRRRVRCSEFC